MSQTRDQKRFTSGGCLFAAQSVTAHVPPPPLLLLLLLLPSSSQCVLQSSFINYPSLWVRQQAAPGHWR